VPSLLGHHREGRGDERGRARFSDARREDETVIDYGTGPFPGGGLPIELRAL
jgi:hypothetical protein